MHNEIKWEKRRKIKIKWNRKVQRIAWLSWTIDEKKGKQKIEFGKKAMDIKSKRTTSERYDTVPLTHQSGNKNVTTPTNKHTQNGTIQKLNKWNFYKRTAGLNTAVLSSLFSFFCAFSSLFSFFCAFSSLTFSRWAALSARFLLKTRDEEHPWMNDQE